MIKGIPDLGRIEIVEVFMKDFACEHGFVLIMGSVIVLVTLTISNCNYKVSQITQEKVKVYLSQGCKKEPIIGSTGSHWVCNKD